MNFLITNDDGFDAPGLAALYSALAPLGNVRVVAPAVCHSAKGHAVNTHQPIRVSRAMVEPFGTIEIVEASPADCVRVALRGTNAQPPDVVIAGINPGANLGVDLYYSGTVAAAREAAILGLPAIAVSRYVTEDAPINWQNLTPHVTRVVRQLLRQQPALQQGQFWNVNFPAVRDDKHPEDITFSRHGTLAHDVRFEPVPHDEGPDVQLLKYTGVYQNRGQQPACDVGHTFRNCITATVIDLCTTGQHPSMPT